MKTFQVTLALDEIIFLKGAIKFELRAHEELMREENYVNYIYITAGNALRSAYQELCKHVPDK